MCVCVFMSVCVHLSVYVLCSCKMLKDVLKRVPCLTEILGGSLLGGAPTLATEAWNLFFVKRSGWVNKNDVVFITWCTLDILEKLVNLLSLCLMWLHAPNIGHLWLDSCTNSKSHVNLSCKEGFVCLMNYFQRSIVCVCLAKLVLPLQLLCSRVFC